MNEALTGPASEPVMARAEGAVSGLLALPLDSSTDDDVLALWRRVESLNRRLATLDHALIAHIEQRRLAFHRGASSTVVLARDVLRVSPREAKARVAGAAAAGPRTGLTGEALAPIFAQVASAQGSGTISPQHARVITRCVDRLPGTVQASAGESVEAFLVEQAGIFDPDTLARLARRIIDTLDPDGRRRDHDYRDRMRGLDLRVRADGSSRLEGELTAEATEHLRTAFDALARPKVCGDGQRDPRTASQRRHDALFDVLLRVERAELLPVSGGVSTTVVLTMTAEAFETGEGTATTGHGVTIAACVAREWAGGASKFLAVVSGKLRGIEAYGSSQRLFTENQRLALAVRDGGCSFPGCDAPPQWTEAHHVTDFADGGPTSVCNGTLLCPFHHRHHEALGWRCSIIDGQPWWVPPRWIDSDQVPVRNSMHHLQSLLGV